MRVGAFFKKKFENPLTQNQSQKLLSFLVFDALQLWYSELANQYLASKWPHQNRCSIRKNTNSIFNGKLVGSDIPPWITGIRALSNSFR